MKISAIKLRYDNAVLLKIIIFLTVIALKNTISLITNAAQ